MEFLEIKMVKMDFGEKKKLTDMKEPEMFDHVALQVRQRTDSCFHLPPSDGGRKLPAGS